MSAAVNLADLLAEALGVPASEISETTTLETCASWDSLAHFRIVAAVEETLGRPLTPTEIFEITGFQSISTLLQSPKA